MADSAMTPNEALQTIASIRAYRERLTPRAAGLVWIVWGFALALDLVLSIAFNFVDDAKLVGYDPTARLVALVAGGLFCIGGAAGATNAIWRSHSIGAERPFPAWVPFVAILGFTVGINALLLGLQWLNGFRPFPGLDYAPMLLIAAGGAATLAFLQRRRVTLGPGLGAALSLFGFFLMATFLPIGAPSQGVEHIGALLFALAPLPIYGIVGFAHLRQG